MLVLGGSGAYMAILKLQPGNILGGTFTSYLVATSWIAAKRKQVSTGVIDWGALVLVSALTIVGLTLGMEAATNSTGMKYGYPAGPYFFIGVVGLMAATGDVRMLLGTAFPARNVSRATYGACVLHSLSPPLPYSLRVPISSLVSCEERACCIFSVSIHWY